MATDSHLLIIFSEAHIIFSDNLQSSVTYCYMRNDLNGGTSTFVPLRGRLMEVTVVWGGKELLLDNLIILYTCKMSSVTN
jgi:hypothetical protein